MKGGNVYKKGFWTVEEDNILMEHIKVHGKGKWNGIVKMTGLKRSGKSCRLRWMNYLSPNVKHDDFSEEEDDLIIRLHNLLGNRWSLIAGRVPGRTDNQVKNHWNTHLSKRLGIKEEKFKAKASSRTLSISVAENFTVPLNKHSEPPSNENRGVANQKLFQDDYTSTVGCFDTQELVVNESCQRPFWFSNDDLCLNTPSLIELLDQYSLDFVWDGF